MVNADNRNSDTRRAKLLASVSNLSHAILKRARSGMSRIELLQEISSILIESSEVEVAEWWLREGDGYFRCEVGRDSSGAVRWEADNLDVAHPEEGIIVGTREQQAQSRIYLDLLEDASELDREWVTAHGSFWHCSHRREPSPHPARESGRPRRRDDLGVEDRCFILIPLRGGDEDLGFVSLKSGPDFHFNKELVEFQELVAEAVAVALVHQESQAKLQERLKELRCLYDVVRLADNPDLSLDEILQGVADLLPPAWQYPDKAAGRLILGQRSFHTAGFVETQQMQSAPIVVDGQQRGRIDIVYLKDRPRMHEGPFLREERHLINALAREVSGIIERREARDEQEVLQKQLLHADRLATIGQLAAGVAHEINEPLGNILGFAQLVLKVEEIPGRVTRDLNKIVNACLHAREIVERLRLFARQSPVRQEETDLNGLVGDGLYFIESQSPKHGVAIVRDLDPDLPSIIADAGQLHQVLTNLTVNALQAMPDGGTLTIRTHSGVDGVLLIVEDTGVGMSEELQERVFLPFVTTKEVDQGTGLGLSVVQSIVAAHGGSIEVESRPGAGSVFRVSLPIGSHEEEGQG